MVVVFLQKRGVTNRNSSINISIVHEDILESTLGTITILLDHMRRYLIAQEGSVCHCNKPAAFPLKKIGRVHLFFGKGNPCRAIQ